MTDMTREGLRIIAGLHDGADFKAVSKSDLWEAVKRARCVAKQCLKEEEGEA
jgi:hypothetical protein